MGILGTIKKMFTKQSDALSTTPSGQEIDPIYKKPLNNGLLPGEVVLLKWMDGAYINTSFPNYFLYDYGINAEESAKNLLQKEFIREAMADEALHSLKVTELKEILRENELKVSGKKAELIDRITTNFSEPEIDKYVTNKPLKLAEKGIKTLKTYYYIFPAHQNRSKDGLYNVASAIKYVEKSEEKPNNSDISWALYQEALKKYHKEESYGLYRNVHLNMAEQLQREGKHKQALLNYLEICIIDLSGLSNSGYILHPDLIMLAPGIVSRIQAERESNEISEESFKELFSDAWSSILPSLPFHYLDQETSYACLLAYLNEDEAFIKDALMKSFEKLDKKTRESTYNLKLPLSR